VEVGAAGALHQVPADAKEVFDATPKACLYAPLKIAVLENEKDGSTSVMFDSPNR